MWKLMLVAALVASCGDRRSEDRPAAPAAHRPDAPPKPSATEAPAATGTQAAPAAKVDGLPPECVAYRAAADQAASCAKLGGKRDELRADLERSWAAWKKLDAAARAALTKNCAELANTIRAVTATACP
ncbi:MAG: hypothetical protein KF773_35905 [Deltaproteobacteria bacterium]|nr:hypothetical protein [Deltaproteobacteria bacterium]MCW5803441.1 hypothetical protein [Deltaproteobacteria bacterium]